MSAQVLTKILRETEKQLEKSKNLRKVSDLKAHTITISWIDVRRELKKELGFITKTGKSNFQEYIDLKNTGGKELKALNELIDKEAKEIVRACRAGAEQDAVFLNRGGQRRKYPSYVKIEGTPLNFVITLFISKNDIRPIKIWGGKKEVAGTVFSTARNYYSKRAKEAGVVINAALGRAKNKRKPKINLAHAEENSIARQRVDTNKSFLIDKLSKESITNPKITQADIDILSTFITMEKSSDLDRDVINTTLGSGSENQREGFILQRAELEKWREDLRSAILKINSSKHFAERKGSDSRVTVEKKKIINRAKKGFKAHKNLKTNFEDSRIKQTKNYNKSIIIKPKIFSGTKTGVSGAGASKAQLLKKTSANSTIGLMAILNAKLPGVVKENMGAPGLENRTGKFASSVRVLEVTKTTQGFPSVGYTYEKNPYQIFEKGAGKVPWATVDRDPRVVIDRSIREIAAGIMAGRFYTRRI